MSELAALRRSFAGPGRLMWIGLRPARLADMHVVSEVRVTESGLQGDRGRRGKRAVTLIQHEHLEVIAALSGRDALLPHILRRNLVVSGLNLTAAREHGLRIGDVRLRLTAPCAPCSRMEAALGPGGYNAMRGHGGWCAEVVAPGTLVMGEEVAPDLP